MYNYVYYFCNYCNNTYSYLAYLHAVVYYSYIHTFNVSHIVYVSITLKCPYVIFPVTYIVAEIFVTMLLLAIAGY